MQSLRNAVFELARERYSPEAECLWARTPNFGVLRHPNGKWITVLLDDTIDMEQIAILLDISYDIAGTKTSRRKPK